MSNSGGQQAPVTTLAAGTDPVSAPIDLAYNMLFDSVGGAWNRQRATRGIADGDGGFNTPGVSVGLFNGATWDRQRTPTWIDNAAASAVGSTPLHTPAAGKKVRLMRYIVLVTGNAAAAAAAVLNVRLLDAAVGTNVNHRFFVPNAAATTLGGLTTGWIDLGNGYLSTAANAVLNVDLSFALTAGTVNVIACGTEE